MKTFLGVIAFLAFLAFSIFQLVVGSMGIEDWLGWWWAFGAVLLAFLRFTLPLTIGVFFGARDVLGWHWSVALLVAAPGLLLMVPGIIAALIQAVRGR